MTAELETERLDVSQFEISVKDNPNIKTDMAIVGLGATGSSFILLLAHFLKYNRHYNIHLFDHDYIQSHNHFVSLYGFANKMGIRINNDSKADSSYRILKALVGSNDYGRIINENTINNYNQKVSVELLESMFGKERSLDYIMVFTDNNESRYEVAQYQEQYPDTIVFDIRVGSYDQFEVYYSNNPIKYMKTIYFDDDGSLTHIDGNRVCQDERMHFSIAMAGASLLMNLFTKYIRDEFIDVDFKHIMFGRDYIGEVKGYE